MPTTKELFNVWIKRDALFSIANTNYVVPDGSLSFDQEQVLKSEGWEMVWDSAPSAFAGAKYAADNWSAYVPATVAWADPV